MSRTRRKTIEKRGKMAKTRVLVKKTGDLPPGYVSREERPPPKAVLAGAGNR